jgi:DNA-binding NtrC family response regulator
MATIIVVDDEPHMRAILTANLQQGGHVVIEASGVAEAKNAISGNEYDVVITDHKMPDGSGIDVLNLVRQDDPTASVIFLTAVGSIELAVESIRGGAFDFLTKPFLPEVIRATAARAGEHTRLLRENSRLKNRVLRLEASSDIIGSSPAILKVREDIARVAPTNATVLIVGETGTGKELVARSIHKSSPRANHAFVAINCAALPESLVESELFGHERGAFTGADRAREGLFEAAHLGTMFLDEVAELSPAAQAKLLRVLNDGQLTRVGSSRARTVDVRVITATHRNLQDRVREGLFREDLYYRLAVFPISIPPLRQRKEDIPELSREFIRRAATELKVPVPSLSESTLRHLMTYEFPGNIRELRNLIERACILANGSELSKDMFPGKPGSSVGSEPMLGSSGSSLEDDLLSRLPESLDLRKLLNTLERRLIERALLRTGGAQAEAARQLGLSRSDLGYKLGKHEIKVATE